jgi:hypothetical protein
MTKIVMNRFATPRKAGGALASIKDKITARKAKAKSSAPAYMAGLKPRGKKRFGGNGGFSLRGGFR